MRNFRSSKGDEELAAIIQKALVVGRTTFVITNNTCINYIAAVISLYSELEPGEKTYKRVRIGKRLVNIPHPRLKVLLQTLDQCLKNILPRHERCFSYATGVDFIRDMIRPLMVGKRVIAHFDIHKFFDNIRDYHVQEVFERCELPEPGELTKVVTYNGFLPQGSPVAPTISNAVLVDIDESMTIRHNGQERFVYARYSDDIYLATSEHWIPKMLEARLKRLLSAKGFELNPRDTQYMRHNSRQVVMGINVRGVSLNDSAIYIPWKRIERLVEEFLRAKPGSPVAWGKHNYVQRVNTRQSNLLATVLSSRLGDLSNFGVRATQLRTRLEERNGCTKRDVPKAEENTRGKDKEEPGCGPVHSEVG